MKQHLKIITPLSSQIVSKDKPFPDEDRIAYMDEAKRFGREYWDGDKGYGDDVHLLDTMWDKVADKLIETYNLGEDARILDVGCGQAGLLSALEKRFPKALLRGFDASPQALETVPKKIQDGLIVHRAGNPYPWPDNLFDLVVSFNVLHNLEVHEIKSALEEMERTGKDKFICVASYRTNRELCNLQRRAATCESFFSVRSWKWLFKQYGYTGDFEFIFFE